MIVPSRGRPDAAERVRASFLRTAEGRTSLVFALDEDDDSFPYPPIKFISKSTSTVSALNNAAKKYASEAKYVGFIGDDCRFITKGWDVQMMQVCEEMGGGVVYANDLMDPGALPTSMIMSSDIVRALGFMAPPQLKFLAFDNYWLQLGRAIGKIKYLDQVVIQHISLPTGTRTEHADFQVWAWYQGARMASDIQTVKRALGLLPSTTDAIASQSPLGGMIGTTSDHSERSNETAEQR